MSVALDSSVPEGFPNHPQLRDNFAPLHGEFDLERLQLGGRWPEALRGSFYRIGPNPQFPPMGGNYHWFGGDGMVHAFHIDGGEVSYRNRYMRTQKFLAESDAGRALLNPLTSDSPDPAWGDRVSDGVANTAMIFHHDRLFALEEAHAPMACDPRSLETLGVETFGGRLPGSFTAHPHIDASTGNLVFFGNMAGGMGTREISYGEIAPDGRLLHSTRIESPQTALVHDFLVTESTIVIPIFPLTLSIERAMQGGPAVAWEPDQPTWLGVLPRMGDGSEVRWIEADPIFVFHFMNAWDVPGEEGKRIQSDTLQFDLPPLFPLADGSMPPNSRSEANLRSWDLDLENGRLRWEEIDPMRGEFPRIDERFACGPNRHGWFAGAQGEHPRGISNNSVVHYDRVQGELHAFGLPASDAIGEPVFVPRPGSTREGDGWVLALAWRGEENVSELLLFDALAVADGPVATAKLPHRVPHGFHALFRPDAA